MLNDAYEKLVDEQRRRHARRAFDGIMALMWTHYTPEEIKKILLNEVAHCDDVL